jgi:pyruvate formate lyase activating enzyme
MAEETPFLKADIPVTFNDHPGVQSAVLYTDINLCNLNCFQCHNRNTYNGDGRRFTAGELKEKLSMLKLLGVELLIVSGGEPTLVEGLRTWLKFLKKHFPVRVDTNGTKPEIVKTLIAEGAVDGFAVDIKIPLKKHYSEEELRRFKKILFSTENIKDRAVYHYAEQVLKTLKVLKEKPLPFTILRTINYPLLTGEDAKAIKALAEPLRHTFNPFYPVEVAHEQVL